MAKELTYNESNIYFDDIDAAIQNAEGISNEQRILTESVTEALRDGKMAGLDGQELKEYALSEVSKKMTLEELGYEQPDRPANMSDDEYETYCNQSEAAFLENDEAKELYEKLYGTAMTDRALNKKFDNVIKNMPDVNTTETTVPETNVSEETTKTNTDQKTSLMKRLQKTATSVKNYVEQKQLQETTDITLSN